MAKGDFKRRYNELLETRNYRELSNLLRNTNYKTQEARDRAFSMADEFEEQADIDDKLLGGATESQKAAYSFITDGPRKRQDGTMDEYSSTFSDAWNAMADSDGYIHINTHYNLDVTGINFKKKRIVDEDYLDLFSQGSGIPITEFEKNGIIRGKDGELLIATDNPNKVNIFNGIKAVVDNGDEFTLDRLLPTKNFDNDIYRTKYVKNDYYMGSVVRHPFYDMKDIVTKANEEYAGVMDNQTPYVLQTVVTGYMGEDDKRLQQAFSNGAIDLQTFKEARALLEEKYNRLLQNNSLTQYEVWSMSEDNNGSQLLQKLEDNILKGELNAEINLAMAEGRLHYAHASNGLQYGTMITIDQKLDSKGNPVEEHPGRRFFVKDLFKSEAENSLREDTQVDAQLKYAKHQTYGHVYRGKDNSRLENWDSLSDSAEYVDEFGTRRVVSKAEALNIMDDDIIARRLIDYYRKANLRTTNGRLYTEEGSQVYGNNGYNTSTLIENIKKKALQVVAAKYGDPDSEYVKIKANKLASTIMQNLDIDLENSDELI